MCFAHAFARCTNGELVRKLTVKSHAEDKTLQSLLRNNHKVLAPPERFELPTPSSEAKCSNPLSYGGKWANYTQYHLNVKI